MKCVYCCVIALVLGGCVNSAELNAKLQSQVDAAAPGVVLKPAAFELNCDASQLTMQKVGQAQYGVSQAAESARPSA